MRRRNAALRLAAAFCGGAAAALVLPAGWVLCACAAVVLFAFAARH